MNSLSIFYSYLLLNAWLIIGYGITRGLLNLSYVKTHLRQKQRLKLARLAFLLVTLMPLLGQKILSCLPYQPSLNFQLQSFLHKASTHLNVGQPVISWHQPITIFGSSAVNGYDLILALIVIGMLIFIYRYIKEITSIKKLIKTSYQLHAIKGVCVLFSADISIPCCANIWRRAYVIVPNSLLEEKNDLKVALQHEFQHLRQGDTKWLHILAIFKGLCFFNPLLAYWIRWFNELHEFACDEALILRNKVIPADYGQCLLNVAKTAWADNIANQSILATQILTNPHSSSLLKRRITMLFCYQQRKTTPSIFWIIAIALIGLSSMATYAMNHHNLNPLSTAEIIALFPAANNANELQLNVTPEVVTAINQIRTNPAGCEFMRVSLKRMAAVKPMISAELKQRHLPQALLALPLAESGYQPLPENKVQSAGIWQIIPSTGRHYGLVVKPQYDERFDIAKATQAALTYLTKLHTEFNDWNLAIMAYNQGEEEIHHLIAKTGQSNPWQLIRSGSGNPELKKYLPSVHAAAIIMQHPNLLD